MLNKSNIRYKCIIQTQGGIVPPNNLTMLWLNINTYTVFLNNQGKLIDFSAKVLFLSVLVPVATNSAQIKSGY